MKKYIVFLLVLMTLFAVGCTKNKITNFDDCVKAGNPVMESYPRQCNADGQTFTEEIKEDMIVGGDKDEHGCIGSAGYSWCEEKQKCLRVWEENCTEEV